MNSLQYREATATRTNDQYAIAERDTGDDPRCYIRTSKEAHICIVPASPSQLGMSDRRMQQTRHALRPGATQIVHPLGCIRQATGLRHELRDAYGYDD